MADDSSLATTLTDTPDTGSGLGAALTPPTLNRYAGYGPATDESTGATAGLAALPAHFREYLERYIDGAVDERHSRCHRRWNRPATARTPSPSKTTNGAGKYDVANARAAHEVAMAHQADVEYQNLQQNFNRKRRAGV